jgi:hypothetical protein
MALNTLSAIKTAALTELDRTDLDTYADDFITLAEGHFNRNLRHRKMVTTTDLSPTSNVYTLPTDYLDAVRVVEKRSIRRELQFVTPGYVDQQYPDRASGLPQDYTIIGSSLYVYPYTSNDVELTYYQKIPTLISNDPNWLLTDNPQLYLRGIQLEALSFINETASPRFQFITAITNKLIDEMNAESEMALYSGASMRVRGVTP